MSYHVDIATLPAAPLAARRVRGARAWQSGAAAEGIAVRLYRAAGLDLLEHRWRGQGGEIDLILRDGDVIVFAEVKQARSHDAARASLRPAQMRRIHAAASEYLGGQPQGLLSEVRFDLVTVDGTGDCKVMEGALSHF
ncbi:YraN family protein [Roseovarius sp. ZX-A-9]|uniref:YraN family protein n=1 Tax=Roseovarius sp. ZX-A-9 TaxID=3014783 RepID=UPI002330C51C|nr:YraN family protein [Roseovarius sp. ZX-A-9]